MTRAPGISGFSLQVPKLRVPLAAWAEWTDADPSKVEAVVGRSFRVCSPRQNVYTLAADAVLDLIERFDVDPADIGMLALGTESSTDNAAGAVLVRGMLDEVLPGRGRGPVARTCEVPEFKHACLGGVYALKAAARYLGADGRGRRAIVVASDIAEYERGSTGEQTQGAGAVAMLLDTDPALCHLNLDRSGSASAYRGLDFRKPFARHRDPSYAQATQRLHDFPIFNGTYSTQCYVEATVRAIDAMFERVEGPRADFYDRVAAVCCHRPYEHMPMQAMAAVLVWSAAKDGGAAALAPMCEGTDLDPAQVYEEIKMAPDLYARVKADGIAAAPFPAFMALTRVFRRSPAFKAFASSKLRLGNTITADLGNLYTASLPGWLGAAFEAAHAEDRELAGRDLLAVGYGSGDAAEAIPMTVAAHWREAAAKLDFTASLQGAHDLTREQYEALHDGAAVDGLPEPPGFVVSRVGETYDERFQDLGVDYYDFCG
ncbi:MAG: hydroxymethylglutaryl-CoA synthase [Nannocystales bacterium]